MSSKISLKEDVKIADRLAMLATRHMEEGQYEPFEDYIENMCRLVEHNTSMKFVRLQKRPFAVTVEKGGVLYKYQFRGKHGDVIRQRVSVSI